MGSVYSGQEAGYSSLLRKAAVFKCLRVIQSHGSQVGLRRGLIALLCSQGPWWLDLAVAGSRSPNNSMVSHTEIASPFGLVSGSLW